VYELGRRGEKCIMKNRVDSESQWRRKNRRTRRKTNEMKGKLEVI